MELARLEVHIFTCVPSLTFARFPSLLFHSFVRCGARVDDFASKVNLPEEWTSIDTHNTGVPPLFIVNVQVRRPMFTKLYEFLCRTARSFNFFSTRFLNSVLTWVLSLFFVTFDSYSYSCRRILALPFSPHGQMVQAGHW